MTYDPMQPPLQPRPAMVRLPIPSHRVLITWLLIAANAGVLLLMEANGGSENGDTLIAFGAKVNSLINAGEWWRLFTAMFLHIGLIHLAVNCFSLYNVGSLLERFIGSLRFTVLYLLAGLCGSLASYRFSPTTVSAGASGAIFGLLGGLGVFFFLHRSLFGKAANSILSNIVIVALLNLGLGATLPGIDNFAHVGGLAGGLVLGVILSPRYKVVADSFGQPRVVEHKPAQSWLWVALFCIALALATVLAIRAGTDSGAALLDRPQATLAHYAKPASV